MTSDPATDNAAEQLILGMTVSEMAALFRAATERAVDEHLAAGRSVYGSYGADRVYAIVPQRLEPDGTPSHGGPTGVPEARAS